MTAAPQQTRLGMEIKDQVTALLRQRHAAIEVFIDEQIAKGLTLKEVIAFGSIEIPLVPTVTTADGRVLVTWPFRLSIDDGD